MRVNGIVKDHIQGLFCFHHKRAYFPPYPNFDNQPTKSPIIKRCIALLQIWKSEEQIKQIHAFSMRNGVSLSNPDMGKHLIYSVVSLSDPPISYAHQIFSQIQTPNIFTINTMIRGYAESEDPKPALKIYQHNLISRVEPDTHSYPFVLKACSKLLALREGEQIHGRSVRDGFESLEFVQNSLIHFYAVCGFPENAHQLFEEMHVRKLVAWNSVINGFCNNGRPNEALTLFRQMSLEDVKPDEYTMVSLLGACAELGALSLGKRAHAYLFKNGLNENLHVGNALIDFYSKCGNIKEASKVFEEMKMKSVVSWTSLIVGLAVNGFSKDALELFSVMEKERLRPSEITFVGVLYACSHCGMVDEGFDYFKRMTEEYGIVPKIEHYGCMIDLMGRAGLLDDAHEFINKMPLKPNAVIWRTLLGACWIHGNVALGEIARVRLLHFETHHSGDYVLLSNLYALEGRWNDVQKVRKTMFRQGVKKIPGRSLVELRNCIHEFVMGDVSHPETEKIYEMLEEIEKLLRLEGYVPHTSNVLADIEDEEKEKALNYHSEKIAIAFMLVKTPPGSPIRVIKNLRVCGDCHSAIKLISKLFDREIIVRDRSRFHHFRDGLCCCKDYW